MGFDPNLSGLVVDTETKRLFHGVFVGVGAFILNMVLRTDMQAYKPLKTHALFGKYQFRMCNINSDLVC